MANMALRFNCYSARDPRTLADFMNLNPTFIDLSLVSIVDPESLPTILVQLGLARNPNEGTWELFYVQFGSVWEVEGEKVFYFGDILDPLTPEGQEALETFQGIDTGKSPGGGGEG